VVVAYWWDVPAGRTASPGAACGGLAGRPLVSVRLGALWAAAHSPESVALVRWWRRVIPFAKAPVLVITGA